MLLFFFLSRSYFTERQRLRSGSNVQITVSCCEETTVSFTLHVFCHCGAVNIFPPFAGTCLSGHSQLMQFFICRLTG